MLLGVDVWLNTPQYPFEASGTSGMKAGMNGTLNLSVLDGWWAEGFDTRNGWGIFPHTDIEDADERDEREAHELLTLIEQQVIPGYYERNEENIPTQWVRMIKASMRSIIPRFNALRMLQEYSAQLYVPAAGHGRRMRRQDGTAAGELASWKKRTAQAWTEVGIRRLGQQPGVANGSPSPPSKVAVDLAGLSIDEVVVECVWGTDFDTPAFALREKRAYRPIDEDREGEVVYELEFQAGFAASELARYEHRVRIYPRNDLLAHPAETGRMRWLS